MSFKAEFVELGGYDCMTDAIYIKNGFHTIAVLDGEDFGQARCSSLPGAGRQQMETFAQKMVEALNKAESE